MRIVIGSDVPLENWSDFSAGSKDLRAYWNVIKRYCILNYSESEIANSQRQIRRLSGSNKILHSNILDEVAAMLGQIPANLSGAEKVGPMTLSHPDSSSGSVIEEMVNRPDFWKKVEEAHQTPKRHESRDEVFNRLIRASLYTANAVSIFDKYAGASLEKSREDSGTYWLLAKLLQSPVGEISMFTYQAETKNGSILEISSLVEAFEEACANIHKSNKVLHPKTVKFYILENYSTKRLTFQHDRHIKFVFNGRRGLALTLGSGADVFRDTKLKQDHTIAEISIANAEGREAIFTASSGMVTPSKVVKFGPLSGDCCDSLPT